MSEEKLRAVKLCLVRNCAARATGNDHGICEDHAAQEHPPQKCFRCDSTVATSVREGDRYRCIACWKKKDRCTAVLCSKKARAGSALCNLHRDCDWCRVCRRYSRSCREVPTFGDDMACRECIVRIAKMSEVAMDDLPHAFREACSESRDNRESARRRKLKKINAGDDSDSYSDDSDDGASESDSSGSDSASDDDSEDDRKRSSRDSDSDDSGDDRDSSSDDEPDAPAGAGAAGAGASGAGASGASRQQNLRKRKSDGSGEQGPEKKKARKGK